MLCARLLLGLTYSRWERESNGGRVLELSNEGDTAFEWPNIFIIIVYSQMRVRRLLHPTRFLKAGATCHERILNETCFSNRMKRRKKHSTNKKNKRKWLFFESFFIFIVNIILNFLTNNLLINILKILVNWILWNALSF